MIGGYKILIRNQVLARHVAGLLQTHDVQDGGRHVGQTTVLNSGAIVVRHIDKRHRIQ